MSVLGLWEGVRYLSSAVSPATKSIIGEIPGVIEIAGSLYVKSPEALKLLLKALKRYDYDIKGCRHEKDRPDILVQRKKGWPLWYARLSETLLQRRGRCNSCGSYIDTSGIRSHKHRCEACDEYTYLKYVDGSIVRFDFVSEERAFRPSLKMKVYDYDDESGCLLLYPVPEDGNDFNDWGVDKAMAILEENKDKFTHVERDGRDLISIRYDPYDIYVKPDAVISMRESLGHVWNHKIVKLFQDTEYDEWSRLPVNESFSIYEAWHWMPLPPSPNLHEEIIHAAGMVSDCGYYYQDGRAAFFDEHLKRMRLFVEHFTTLDLEA